MDDFTGKIEKDCNRDEGVLENLTGHLETSAVNLTKQSEVRIFAIWCVQMYTMFALGYNFLVPSQYQFTFGRGRIIGGMERGYIHG